MKISTPKPNSENLGEWNVYVCEGKTKEDRKARLLQTPERLQSDVKKHAISIFNLRKNIMDNINKVLTAMEPACIYRPCDLVGVAGLSLDEIRRILKKLANGMIVETIKTGEYRRKVLYQSKQRKLL